MTPRARAYITIAGLRHLLVGAFCLAAPEQFRSSSYQPIKTALPAPESQALLWWGVMFVGTAMLAATAAVRGREGIARWALLASVLSSAVWAAGFVAGAIEGVLTGPTGPIIWTAVTLKDITMLRAPMRNPFEPVIRKALADTIVR
jgi:hypothetical protein